GAEPDDEEREHGAEEEVGVLQEVAGPGVAGVVAQEGRPGLTGWTRRARSSEGLLDRPLAQGDTQLGEFAADALGTPEPILAGHAPEERDRVRRDARRPAARSRAPVPEEPEALAVPAEERLGLDDQQRLAPRPNAAREQDQEWPVGAG